MKQAIRTDKEWDEYAWSLGVESGKVLREQIRLADEILAEIVKEEKESGMSYENMPQFDFVAAWREVANPAYLALPQNLRDLFETVREVAKDLQQDKNLDMPWPEGLKSQFDEIPAEELSKAAHVIYCWGHWGGMDSSSGGAYWKFSRYADQSLRPRLGMDPSSTWEDPPRGLSFKVCDGLLRLCYSSRDLWTWTKIGLATVGTMEKARKLIKAARENGVNEEDIPEELKKANLLPKGFIRELRDIEKYMKPGKDCAKY